MGETEPIPGDVHKGLVIADIEYNDNNIVVFVYLIFMLLVVNLQNCYLINSFHYLAGEEFAIDLQLIIFSFDDLGKELCLARVGVADDGHLHPFHFLHHL